MNTESSSTAAASRQEAAQNSCLPPSPLVAAPVHLKGTAVPTTLSSEQGLSSVDRDEGCSGAGDWFLLNRIAPSQHIPL